MTVGIAHRPCEAAVLPVVAGPMQGPTSAQSVGICAQLEAILVEGTERDWHLEVAASSLVGAGEGVFLRGTCTAGSVVAIYPGVAFAPDDLPTM